MPITISARKKMRQDKTRQAVNRRALATLKAALTKARKGVTPANLKSAFAAIDTAAKKKIIHKSQAARLKSRLAGKLPAGKRVTRKKA